GGQRGIKLQRELCHLRENDEGGKMPSHAYVKTTLKDSQILIRKLPIMGISDWLLIFDNDLFVLAVKELYDEIELLA
ncbi:MAG: hypothetical protein M3M88_08095, partial [Thermoproteota archaeon]|nr:hypothetical protein [Thermoproteota archaeon]